MGTVDHETLGENESAIETRRVIKRKYKERIRATPSPPLSADVIRQALSLQQCPWCDKANFKVLSSHTALIHGITAAQLREMGHLYKNVPTCHKSISKYRSEHVTHIPPSNKIKGYKIKMSKAGREYQDQVRKYFILNLPNKQEIRLKAAQASSEKTSKPHPCPACGNIVPRSHPITCSPECRKVIRQRTAKQSGLKLQKHFRTDAEFMERFKEKQRLHHPLKHLPRACDYCHKIYRKDYVSKFCSAKCRKEWFREHGSPVIRKERTKTCPICSDKFTGLGIHKECCSDLCRKKANRKINNLVTESAPE